MTTANISRFLASWSDELGAQSTRVRDLIGDTHWLTDGQHKEQILKGFIRRYLPPSVSATTGFVIGVDESVSPETDILLTTETHSTSLYIDGDLRITTPENVLASLEVKTSLSTSTMKDAIGKVLKLRKVIHNDDLIANIWSGVFFFEDDATTADKLQSKLESSLKSQDGEIIRFMIKGPVCFAARDAFVAFASPDNDAIKVRFFPAKHLSSSIAIFDLISSVRERIGGSMYSDLDHIITSATGEAAPQIFHVEV